MANTLKLKRSSVAAKVPSTGDLQLGELALNTYDGKLYTKKDNGTATIVEIGAGGGGPATIGTNVTDVLSATAGEITADSAGADKLVFWDQSASKLTYLTVGSNLTVTDTTIAASGGGSGTTFTYSSSAPGSPSAGNEWLDSTSGVLYTYVNDGNSSAWVELGPFGAVIATKTYTVFTPSQNQPPATAFATLDTRNSILVLDFDDATDESAIFVSVIPEAASLGSGLKIRLHWMATTATSGNCVWDVSLERMNTDLDSDSFNTIASATAAANGTSGILTITEITLTTIDSVTAGDGYRLKVNRDANNGSDTMSGDAELVVVEVRSAA